MIYTGKISDMRTGAPLPGANMVITDAKGVIRIPARGTTTNFRGEYGLEASPGDHVMISYLGYETLDMPVEWLKNANLKMQEKIEMLPEVTVTPAKPAAPVNQPAAPPPPVPKKKMKMWPVVLLSGLALFAFVRPSSAEAAVMKKR